MEDYYPSEIARLVLGYLNEVKCTNTWRTFLEESGDLQEHNKLLKQKKRCTTNVRGESLLDILKTYNILKSFFEQIICQYSWIDVLEDISYLQEQYNVHKQKTCYSTQRTGQSVINALRDWVLKISDADSPGSDADQFVYSDLPYNSSSLICLSGKRKNALQNDRECQKTTDEVACLKKDQEKPTQFVDTSEKGNEYPENNAIDSKSDEEITQNVKPASNLSEQDVPQISEGSKQCDSANKLSAPEESLFGSDTSNSESDAYQIVYSGVPYYSSSQVSLSSNRENASQNDKKCQETADKNIQTDLFTCACLIKAGEKSTQFVDTSEKGNEYPENNAIYSKSDQEEAQNVLPSFNFSEHNVTQISEGSKSCDSANKHSTPESSLFDRSQPPLTAESDGGKEKEESSQEKNCQVKRNLFEEPSVSKNHDLSETPLNLENAEQETLEKVAGHVIELSGAVNPVLDKCGGTYSDFSSNIDSNTTKHAAVENHIFTLSETNKYAEECTESVPCDLSIKEASKHISEVTEDTFYTANILASQDAPSDNNSSLLNSEHDLQIVESEIECQVSDHEIDAGDKWTVISQSTCDLQHSSTENKCISQEKESLIKCATNCRLSSLDILRQSIEDNAIVLTDTEMIDKTEAANESTGFVVLPDEMNCLNAIGQSEKQNVCEENGSKTVNESHEAVKSSDVVVMNNSQYSTFISPANQPNTVLSYTTVPEYTVSDLSAQNNIQYQIVLNTPLSWNVPIASGLSLVPPQGLSFVPSLPLSNVSQPTVIAPATTSLLTNAPKQVAVAAAAASSTIVPSLSNAASQPATSSTAVSQVANFETVVSDNLHKSKSVPAVTKNKDDPKKKNSTKQKANEKQNAKEDSKSTAGKHPYPKRCPKRKLPSIFESWSKPKEGAKIPVLSITESPSKSSATKVITKIADEFEDQCKSPVLKLLMTSAQELLKTSKTASPSHVRCLDFNSKSCDEILIGGENDESQDTNSVKKASEILVENEVQNSKLLTNDSVCNKAGASKELQDCGNKSKKRKKNDASSNDKKTKLKKQCKKEKQIAKKGGTPQKVGGKTKKSENDKSPKALSKTRKKTKIQENGTASIEGKKKTSHKKKKTLPESKNDVAIEEENNMSPKKCNALHKMQDGVEIKNVSPKKSFHLKTYENLNKITNKENAKEVTMKKLYKVDSECNHEKVIQGTDILATIKKNNSPSKNNNIQTMNCALGESPRKSQRIANKMTAASNKEISEKIESQKGRTDHCKDKAMLYNTLSKDLQNAVSKPLEHNKVEETNKKHLSPQKNKENEFCKSQQSKKSPKKSDKLQNKKTENKGKIVFNDPGFELQEESKGKQICLKGNSQQQSINKIQANVKKDNSKIRALEEPLMHLKDAKKTPKKECTNSASTTTKKLQQQKCKEDFDNSITCNIIPKKRKLTQPDSAGFELQELSKSKQISLKDISLQKTISKIQRNVEKVNSESEESVVCLEDIKKADEDVASSASASKNLQQQSCKKGFESNVASKTIINKRKMAHPKKRIAQSYFQNLDLQNSVQATVEKVKHRASISPSAVSLLNSIEISNDSVKISHAKLKLNCSKEPNPENVSDISCSSNGKIICLDIDDESKSNEINPPLSNEDSSKNDVAANLDTLNISKSSITASKLLEEAAVQSHLDNAENNFNEVNYLEDNIKEKTASNALQIQCLQQSEDIALEKTEHFLADEECNLDINTNDNNIDNLDSGKYSLFYSESCQKQSNISLSNPSSDDTFHSISSSSDEEASPNISSATYNAALTEILEKPEPLTCIDIDVSVDASSAAAISEVKLCDSSSDNKKVSQKRKDLSLDSPLRSAKRICRKLSTSSEDTCSSPAKSNSKEQNETCCSSEVSTKIEFLESLKRNFIAKRNLNKKFKPAQDSPVRGFQKLKRVLPKTALGKRMAKDPTIPAGVKIPYNKWNNSKIVSYSNEIRQSTKTTKKNINKNIATNTNEKEDCSGKKQILKSVEHKLTKGKQNLAKKLPEGSKLDKEPCVMLTRLCAKPNIQCSLNSNTEKIADQNISNQSDCKQITEYVGEGDVGIRTITNPKTLSHTEPSKNIIQHFETTQDMVEADIGRSNDEGSELFMAIKNCQKELDLSQSCRLSWSPEKLVLNQSEKSICLSNFPEKPPSGSDQSVKDVYCPCSPEKLPSASGQSENDAPLMCSPEKISSTSDQLEKDILLSCSPGKIPSADQSEKDVAFSCSTGKAPSTSDQLEKNILLSCSPGKIPSADQSAKDVAFSCSTGKVPSTSDQLEKDILLSCSPGKVPSASDQSVKDIPLSCSTEKVCSATSQFEIDDHVSNSPEKVPSTNLGTKTPVVKDIIKEQMEKIALNPGMDPKLALIQHFVNLYGPEWLIDQIDKL